MLATGALKETVEIYLQPREDHSAKIVRHFGPDWAICRSKVRPRPVPWDGSPQSPASRAGGRIVGRLAPRGKRVLRARADVLKNHTASSAVARLHSAARGITT